MTPHFPILSLAYLSTWSMKGPCLRPSFVPRRLWLWCGNGKRIGAGRHIHQDRRDILSLATSWTSLGTFQCGRDSPLWHRNLASVRSTFTEDYPTKTLPIQDTDVLYLRLLTKDVVVLNSTEAITDLTEKRSSIYSDRVSSLVKLTS